MEETSIGTEGSVIEQVESANLLRSRKEMGQRNEYGG